MFINEIQVTVYCKIISIISIYDRRINFILHFSTIKVNNTLFLVQLNDTNQHIFILRIVCEPNVGSNCFKRLKAMYHFTLHLYERPFSFSYISNSWYNIIVQIARWISFIWNFIWMNPHHSGEKGLSLRSYGSLCCKNCVWQIWLKLLRTMRG